MGRLARVHLATQARVAVIGAGMSGLAAGIRLAHFGKKVLILEQHAVWGGLNSFYKKGGHHFDVGLHAVTNYLRPGNKGPRVPLQRIYRLLRIQPEEFALEPQTHSWVIFGDARLRFSNALAVLTEEVGRLFPKEPALSRFGMIINASRPGVKKR